MKKFKVKRDTTVYNKETKQKRAFFTGQPVYGTPGDMYGFPVVEVEGYYLPFQNVCPWGQQRFPFRIEKLLIIAVFILGAYLILKEK
ncbi:MAG: hypothetical protein K9H26_10705 [Prolixibacteraceae bacterium]|nr:hypothetical protein [Prolixibacteraceae bacterium]